MRDKTCLIKSSKFAEIAGHLANLTGEVSVLQIINTIMQIPSISEKLVASLKQLKEYLGADGEDVADIFVDMTYQRRVRLAKIVKKLRDAGEFDTQGAGFVDIARRPNGKWYVWDGLRRIIMAGIAGHQYIRVSKTVHTLKMTVSECQIEEARLMDMRNSKIEGMKLEELFKSRVVQRIPEALRMKVLLESCQLDVENVIGSGMVLGGFAELDSNFESGHDFSTDNLVTSSMTIQNTFENASNVSVFLLCGLAYLLQFMDDPKLVGVKEHMVTSEDIDMAYDEEQVKDLFTDWYDDAVGDDGNPCGRLQKELIQPRVNGKTCQSVAWNIATKVLKDNNGLRTSLEKVLGNEATEQLIMGGDDENASSTPYG